MKLKQWLYGATALAMLAACSDKDLAPGTDGGENAGGSGDAMSGYLAVEIKLPQENGTRGSNDVFEDGEGYEYAVDNAMIVVFKGSSEKDATFYKAQDLVKPFFTNLPTDDNITSSYLAAIQVSKTATDTDHFYGLVILNRNEDTTAITKPDANGSSTLTIAGVEITSDMTLNDILSQTTKNSFLAVSEGSNDVKTYSKFFMTNAPLASKRGGSENPTTAPGIQYLTDLGDTTYPTIDEAKSNIQACIYVERAVAKVTCVEGEDPYKLTIYDEKGEEIKNLKISATVRYALTNTNKESYVVRNVEFEGEHFAWNMYNQNYYRMISEKAMPALKSPYHTAEKNLFRTYWCLDPNYETAMGANKNMISKVEDFTSITRPLYCKENTFTVEHQNYANTTLAVFRVDFQIQNEAGEQYGDGNLYIKDGDNTKIYASKEAAVSDELTRIKNNDDILEALRQAAEASGVKDGVPNATSYLEMSYNTQADGTFIITNIALKEADGAFNATGVAKFKEYMGTATTEGSKLYDLLAAINAMNDIVRYTGGVSYYTVPIRHFGDEYCKWNGTGTTTKDVYNEGEKFDFAGEDSNDHAVKYLGRYGLVRNNWYELNISSITALDSPVIPDNDILLSDDNKEVKRYIGVEIHVLSWAKRTQNVNF